MNILDKLEEITKLEIPIQFLMKENIHSIYTIEEVELALEFNDLMSQHCIKAIRNNKDAHKNAKLAMEMESIQRDFRILYNLKMILRRG